jgi:hypothetical protein
MECKDLFTDMRDGVLLINMLEIIVGKSLPRYSKAPKNKFQRLSNLNVALDWIMNKEQIKLVNIGPEDVLEGNPKLMLGLIWTLILHLQLKYGDGGARSALMEWVNATIKPYEDDVPQITNFESNFQNGHVLSTLCTAIMQATPMKFDPAKLKQSSSLQNVQNAIKCADEDLSIPALLDAGDIVNTPDEHSMMTYVSFFRDAMGRRANMQEAVRRPAAENCYAVGAGITGGFVNDVLPFTLIIRDDEGIALSVADTNTLQIAITHPDGDSIENVQCWTDNGDGTYSGTWTPLKAGEYNVAVTVDDTEVRGSAYTCRVIDRERRIIPAPDDGSIHCTIVDKYREYRSYITNEGTCVNKWGDVIGHIALDSEEVGSPDMEYWGNMESNVLYNALERRVGVLKTDKAWLEDAMGNTVCEIDRTGCISGRAGSFLGEFVGCNFHDMQLIALYLFHVDDDMLVEFEDEL